jgi:hypothetical protein
MIGSRSERYKKLRMPDLPEQFILAIDAIEERYADWFAAHPDFALGVTGKPLSHFTILHYHNERFNLLLSRNVNIPDDIELERSIKRIDGLLGQVRSKGRQGYLEFLKLLQRSI